MTYEARFPDEVGVVEGLPYELHMGGQIRTHPSKGITLSALENGDYAIGHIVEGDDGELRDFYFRVPVEGLKALCSTALKAMSGELP